MKYDKAKDDKPGLSNGFMPFDTDFALEAALYIVATPIGNLEDITIRAIGVLKNADVICCEDKRVSGKLLVRYGIKPDRFISYHKYNEARKLPRLLEYVGEGKSLALISDAGTPCISDPGQRLVEQALAVGYKVVPIPGASAVTTALSVSGLSGDGFCFVGYLPVKSGERDRVLRKIIMATSITVMFIPGRDLLTAINHLKRFIDHQRQLVVAREMTKIFEQYKSGTVDELLAFYTSHQDSLRGESVLMIAGSSDRGSLSEADIDAMLIKELKEQTLKSAVMNVTVASGAKRKTVYARALAIAKNNEAK